MQVEKSFFLRCIMCMEKGKVSERVHCIAFAPSKTSNFSLVVFKLFGMPFHPEVTY